MRNCKPADSILAGILLLITGWLHASLVFAGELSATVAWGQRLVMGTLAPGVVKDIKVRPGDRVRAGALLLTLDQQAYRARLVASQAYSKRAEILLEEARHEFDRAQELYDRTVLSEHELTVAKIGLRKAQAEAASAAADVAEARMQLTYSQLKAPFSGIVVRIDALVGQAVNADNGVPEMLVLADDSTLHVQSWGDAATLDSLVAAPRVEVRLGGRNLPSKAIMPGLEVRKTPQGQSLYPITVVVGRAAGLEVRAGQAARIIW